MPEVNLTQHEAQALIEMHKFRVDNQAWEYPDMGGAISVPLVGSDRTESFLLDISCGRIDLLRVKYQNRARHVVVLVRLDLGGQPHRNPDDKEIAAPHIHLYWEGFGDKWAFPVPENEFPNLDRPGGALQDFMRYCNIVEPPMIERGLFA